MAGTAVDAVRGGDRPQLRHTAAACGNAPLSGAGASVISVPRGVRYVTTYAGHIPQTDAAAVLSAGGGEAGAGHAALGSSQASARQTLSDRKPGLGNRAGSMLTIRSPNAAERPMYAPLRNIQSRVRIVCEARTSGDLRQSPPVDPRERALV